MVLGALDIGTQTTTLLAGEIEDGHINIVGRVSATSNGVKKGVIRDIEKTTGVIQRLRAEMSRKYNVDLYDVMVGFSAHEVQMIPRSGRKSLPRGHEITPDDIDAAEENASSEDMADASEVLLQRFRQRYEVNGQSVAVPLGMTGTELVANVLELTASKTSVDALRSAVTRAGLRVTDIVFSGLAATETVLDARAREEGAILIDFGAGTTDFIAFCNGVVAAAGSLGVGGNHLTNDLAQAFQLQQKQAEDMKLSRGSAVLQPKLTNDRYPLSMTRFATSDRSVSVHAIQTVTTERVEETFRIIRSMLEETGVLPQIHGNIYLTGGSAALPQITEKVSNIFKLPCTLGSAPNQNHVRLPAEMMDAPFAHATEIGLLLCRARILSQEGYRPSLLSRLGSFLRG